jgi:hypothetical protein
MSSKQSAHHETHISRRRFLNSSAVAAGSAVFLPQAIRAAAQASGPPVAPSNRITMGCIGVGGQGTGNMHAFLGQPDVQVVAVCDVDAAHRDRAKGIVEEFYAARDGQGSYSGCAAYNDFRDLLARDDIDAVSICPPDHWHGLIAVAAAEAGKDMYCEKPLANTIAEGRAVVAAVKRFGRVFQTGSHERSRANARFACELVRNGRIGKLEAIEVNMPVDHGLVGPQPPMPVPPGFDYNLWLGPCPWEPYTEKRCHFYFRYILDYSGGEMTDRGAHVIDLAQLGNGTSHTGPVSVEGRGVFATGGLFNTAIDYDVTFTYADGLPLHVTTAKPRGVKFVGSDGWVFIHVHGGNLEADPPSLLQEVIDPGELHLGRSLGHHRDFLDAVHTRGETMAPAEAGHRTATMCHLANIAMLVGRKLQWDPVREEVVGDPIANAMVSRAMREPWRL